MNPHMLHTIHSLQKEHLERSKPDKRISMESRKTSHVFHISCWKSENVTKIAQKITKNLKDANWSRRVVMVYYSFHIMRSQRTLMLLKTKLLTLNWENKVRIWWCQFKIPRSSFRTSWCKAEIIVFWFFFFLGSGCQL